ncbi:MAG: Lin0512 family protein [Pseudomonadota bacterium]
MSANNPNHSHKDLKPLIMEMGQGIALHSGDYTKAAKRAVLDALHHSSLTIFRSLGRDPNDMEIELTIAAQAPDQVDLAALVELFPYGHVTPRAVRGGLDVTDASTGDPCVIVNAAVVVRLRV